MASPYATGRRYQNVYKGTVLDGPLFKTDAGRTTKKHINKLITKVLRAGVSEVRQELYKGHGRKSGEYRRSIRSRKRGISGRIFSRNGAIGAWLEGTSRRNQTTRFKGYGVWTKARQDLEAGMAQDVRTQINDLVRELGG